MNKLSTKRKRVIYTLIAITISNSLITAVPYLEIELIKKFLLTFANVVMFILIWNVYFDEQLAKKSNFFILQDLFAVTCLSVITTFVLSNGITKIIDWLITIFGAVGFGIAGATAGIITATVGVMWASYCDDLYRNSPS